MRSTTPSFAQCKDLKGEEGDKGDVFTFEDLKEDQLKEIKGDNDYGRIREKLIGKTLEIQSAFEQALEAFTGSIQNSRAKSFLQ